METVHVRRYAYKRPTKSSVLRSERARARTRPGLGVTQATALHQMNQKHEAEKILRQRAQLLTDRNMKDLGDFTIANGPEFTRETLRAFHRVGADVYAPDENRSDGALVLVTFPKGRGSVLETLLKNLGGPDEFSFNIKGGMVYYRVWWD